MRQIQSNQFIMLNHIESILAHLQDNHSIEKSTLSQNDFHDFRLPLDNEVDLSTIEDKNAGDNTFKSHLVILEYIFIHNL